jgi:hypothetical protein
MFEPRFRFPTIQATLRILDSNNDPITGLLEQDFDVTETHPTLGTAPITNLQVSPQGGYISACLTMDSSGSMSSSELQEAVNGAKSFIGNWKPNDRGAVIDFDSSVRVAQAFTGNHQELYDALDTLTSGGSTALFDAIATSVELTAQEINTPVVMPYTDGWENASSRFTTKESLVNYISSYKIPVYTIGYSSGVDEPTLQYIADETGGQYYYAPDPGDFADIYQAIVGGTALEYVLTFSSPHDIIDGTTRTLCFEVTTPFGVCTACADYDVADPISIMRTQATINLSSQTQDPDIPLAIGTQVTGGQGSLTVQLFYRQSGTSVFSNYQMTGVGGDTYEYEIPGSDVQTPGIDYYITATDGTQVASDPAQDPADYPYSISVFPNEAPVIIHNPVTSGCENQAIMIDAEISDSTDYVEEAILFYKRSSHILYQQITMSNTAGNNYQGVIPDVDVTLDGVDYYISAKDNRNVFSYHGYAYDPHPITVSDCASILNIWTDRYTYTVGDTLFMGMSIDNRGNPGIQRAGFTLTLETPYGSIEIYNLSIPYISSRFFYEEPMFLSGTITHHLPPGNYRFLAAITSKSFPVAIAKADWEITGTGMMEKTENISLNNLKLLILKEFKVGKSIILK